jgi:P27 family predicted phage terminase small subunit
VGAVAEWGALAPVLVDLELLTRADLRTLELCCETLATATALETTIRAEGFTIAAATGGQKSHPCLKALETTRNAALRMLSDFGLSPKARKFVQKAPGAKRDNPFAFLDADHKTEAEKQADQEQFDRTIKEIKEKALAKNPEIFDKLYLKDRGQKDE